MWRRQPFVRRGGRAAGPARSARRWQARLPAGERTFGAWPDTLIERSFAVKAEPRTYVWSPNICLNVAELRGSVRPSGRSTSTTRGDGEMDEQLTPRQRRILEF